MSKSQSKLVTYVDISPYCIKGRNHVIDSVAIHTMGGNMTLKGLGNLFHLVEASCNYGIDEEGNVGMYVKEDDTSICTSNRGVDSRCITIEVASTAGEEPFKCTDKAYETLINLLVDICRRHNIKGLKWQNNMAYAKVAAGGGPVDKQNMFVHRWFKPDISCPGKFLFTAHALIATEVNKRLNSSHKVPDNSKNLTVSDNSGKLKPATTSTEVQVAQLTVDHKQLKPYIATIDRNTNINNLQFKNMRSNGVSGFVIEGGYLFDSSRKLVSNFRSPQAYTQTEKVKAEGFSHGYYMLGRAHTINEADKEIENFAFLIRKYPPALGAWITLDRMTSNLDLNDKIVNKYRDELVRLGLKGKIGLYVSESQLKQIHWDKHKYDWLLWIVKHVSNLQEVNKLLDPEFFDMSGRYV